jgi:solute carrier family 26 (sodium-independent sulfate anion transporter), member 11
VITNVVQEILAQGTANFLGPFVGGYCCTGSFGASAVLSKAGVRTPLAGLFSGGCLLLALYALTSVFYFIPNAALAGLIIHSVYNLITPPRSLYRYWQLSPLELLIWLAGVVIALFTSLETSIYVTIALSLVLLLVRLARTKGRFMGRVRIGRIAIDISAVGNDKMAQSSELESFVPSRDAYLPEDGMDATNPEALVEQPYPGIFVYRFSEGFNYVNQAQQMDTLMTHVLASTRCTQPDLAVSPSDRLWNDPGPTRASTKEDREKPILRAVVLDCSTINNIDITSVQGLVDARNYLDRHAKPQLVEWHFANLHNRWTRRAFAVAGFGFPAADQPEAVGNWDPVFTISHSIASARGTRPTRDTNTDDEESHSKQPTLNSTHKAPRQSRKGEGSDTTEPKSEVSEVSEASADTSVDTSRPVLVSGMSRPFFHIDLVDAVDAAVRDAKRSDSGVAVTQRPIVATA